jgi:four helix bundle protein
MRDYRHLTVWQRSHALVLTVFRCTDRVARRGPPGLVSQIRRAVMTIPTNLAEGCGHDSRREFARYLAIASASAVELEYLLRLAHDLGVIDAPQHESLAAETVAVRRMCRGLRARVLQDEHLAGPPPSLRAH